MVNGYGTFFNEIVGILDKKVSNEDAEADWHDHKHRVRIFQTKNFRKFNFKIFNIEYNIICVSKYLFI